MNRYVLVIFFFRKNQAQELVACVYQRGGMGTQNINETNRR